MKALADLGRNLVAGLRLALGLPVARAAFQVSITAWLALFAFGLLLEMLLDLGAAGLPATFDRYAPVSEGFRSGVFVLCVVVALVAMRRQAHVLAVLVLVGASLPLLSLAGFAYERWLGPQLVARYPSAMLAWWGGAIVIAAWAWLVLARSGALAMEGDPRRWGAGVLLGAVVVFGAFVTLELAPERQWFVAARTDGERHDYPSPASEASLNIQPRLLAEALGRVGQQRPGVVDVYFVGAATYAAQDVFRRDLALAQGAVAKRFGSDSRSIALTNNRATALEAPLATATNLGIALKAVGERMDRDEDVLMLFLTSHGGREPTLVVENEPLRLEQITPERLRRMLDESGIRWRIIAISACYSGGFVPALADAQTLVMTAAAKDRTSFGCDDESDLTFFTEALFKDAWGEEPDVVRAFEKAREAIARREQAEGLSPPSEPQISVGQAMRDKLVAVQAASGAVR